MKPYVYAYIVSAIWLLLVSVYLPHSKGYEMIASKTWSFFIVNMILFIPILTSLVIADRYCTTVTVKETEVQQKSSAP